MRDFAPWNNGLRPMAANGVWYRMALYHKELEWKLWSWNNRSGSYFYQKNASGWV